HPTPCGTGGTSTGARLSRQRLGGEEHQAEMVRGFWRPCVSSGPQFRIYSPGVIPRAHGGRNKPADPMTASPGNPKERDMKGMGLSWRRLARWFRQGPAAYGAGPRRGGKTRLRSFRPELEALESRL